MTQAARRARLIAGIVVVLFCIFAVRLFDLQVIQAQTLAAEGQQVRTSVTSIPAKRGAIVDSQGIVLANSVQTYHIAVNQRNIAQWVNYKVVDGKRTKQVQGRGPAEAARLLAPLLEMNEAVLGGMLLGDRTYMYLKKNVDAVTYREIHKLRIHGIEWEAVHQRVYPNGNTAAPILGMVNAEDVGSAGLEASMEEYLRGTPGKEAYEIAPNGAVMPQGKTVIEQPVDGATVHTTLYSDLQHLAQDKLDARVREHGAQWGSLVITEVATGRVLVMADSGSVPPDRTKVQPVRAVQFAVEPGSVGKVLTVSRVMDKGLVTPTTAFSVPGSESFPGSDGPINDSGKHGVLPMTTTGILARSSNVGTVKIGQNLTNDEMYDMFRDFGLGEKTGIELPGESPGQLRTPDKWGGRDRYTQMFGQAYAMSALQMATVLATIGNGGVRVPPRIIDYWEMPDGTVRTPEAPQPVQVMSADTAKKMTHMLESVVEEQVGTGKRGKMGGYRVAMKTGTAQIFDGGLKYAATSAALIPAEAPRLAIATILFDPKRGYYGGLSSAPLIADVASDSVRALGIPPSTEEDELYPIAP